MSPIVADMNKMWLAQRNRDLTACFADIGAMIRFSFSFQVIQSPQFNVKLIPCLRLS
jgi:hypothetical protein